MGRRRGRNRTDINSLPIELVDMILYFVDESVRVDRNPLRALEAMAGMGPRAMDVTDDLLARLFGGMLAGLPLVPRAPVRAPTPPPIPPTAAEQAQELPLHSDEENSDDSDSDDEDSDASAYDSDGIPIEKPATYPDGLPADPIIPLSLISRSFLTVARQKLYRKSVYTLSLSFSVSLLIVLYDSDLQFSRFIKVSCFFVRSRLLKLLREEGKPTSSLPSFVTYVSA